MINKLVRITEDTFANLRYVSKGEYINVSEFDANTLVRIGKAVLTTEEEKEQAIKSKVLNQEISETVSREAESAKKLVKRGR